MAAELCLFQGKKKKRCSPRRRWFFIRKLRWRKEFARVLPASRCWRSLVTNGCSTQVKESNTQEPGGQRFKIVASALIVEDGPVNDGREIIVSQIRFWSMRYEAE